MDVFDGWVKAFRLTDDEPVETPNAVTANVASYFSADPVAWKRTTVHDLLQTMERAGEARGLLTCSQGTAGGAAGLKFPLERGLAACARPTIAFDSCTSSTTSSRRPRRDSRREVAGSTVK